MSCQCILNYMESFLKIYTPELLGTYIYIPKTMAEEEFLPFADFVQKTLNFSSTMPFLH